MDDQGNPLLSPGLCYWEICQGMWGFVSPILPQLVGNCNFQECKSPPPRAILAINSPTNPDHPPPSARTCGSGALH